MCSTVVIVQLLHPALKFVVSAPLPNFQLCPSSQQILATPLSESMTATAVTTSPFQSVRGATHGGASKLRLDRLAQSGGMCASLCRLKQVNITIQWNGAGAPTGTA